MYNTRAEIDQRYGRVRDYLVSLFRYQGIEGVVADLHAALDGVARRHEVIVVLYEGRIVGRIEAAEADPEHLGMLMAGRSTEGATS